MHILVKSYGCSTNLADGAVLMGCLAQAGYELTESLSSADIVVLNTCAVKGPTEDRMIEVANRIARGKRLIVTGCLPLINLERLRKEVTVDGVLGPGAAGKVVDVVRRVSNGEIVIDIEGSLDEAPRPTLPRVQLNRVISTVPVSYGCLGSCSYCCVVLARGRLRSCALEEVVQRVETDLVAGFKEFWVTGQDTACYGMDHGSNLAQLLDCVCAIDGEFKIRVGMMTANNALKILEKLIHAFENNKIFKFLHLPVQSGDDGVLQRMCRPYSVNDFKRIVRAFRERFPDLTLATDVICGFPGESEEAFERTLQLLEEVRPDIVNISKFFPRPKTPAAEMQKDFLKLSEISQRSRRASMLASRLSLASNQRWIGWTGEVLIDEIGKLSGSLVGRNFAYKPVAIIGRDSLLGKSVRARVVQAFPTYLGAELVQ
jgi:threonylcarbamoyladenosine tRNA methylthiotransferase CDKAL1